MDKDNKKENENNNESENKNEQASQNEKLKLEKEAQENDQTTASTTTDAKTTETEAAEENESEKPPKDTVAIKLWNHIKKHPLVYTLITIIIVMFLWFSIKINKQERLHTKEKTELIANYEAKIDSLRLRHIEFSTKVFSWSIRSESLRNNTENINQLFNTFVRESDVKLLQFIDASNNEVLISTDKKMEGTIYTFPKQLTLNKEETIIDNDKIRVLIPIMGVNEIIGVLNAEY